MAMGSWKKDVEDDNYELVTERWQNDDNFTFVMNSVNSITKQI